MRFMEQTVSTTPLAITNRCRSLFVPGSMAKPSTPELDPEALSRLDAYAARFRDAFLR